MIAVKQPAAATKLRSAPPTQQQHPEVAASLWSRFSANFGLKLITGLKRIREYFVSDSGKPEMVKELFSRLFREI